MLVQYSIIVRGKNTVHITANASIDEAVVCCEML